MNKRRETRTNVSIKLVTRALCDALQKKKVTTNFVPTADKIFSNINNNNVTNERIKIKNYNK